ncbi:hypothetical protein SELMODRAFT_81328 [Selaginella moellendorffii]|uniref:Protein kinase domain-containing protein n=1 Tax=Selaginella moellendorffii TaxID=88036 RepID=D8QZJ6_SELML|nr:probable leucine-rich repeat receptor-like protein kinase At5g63930 [Selaginella moellendorffii]EFJ34416.1 hypothetical protein SELMODRAFT_81328 [Selaginella moellendorffii]|eukprot:XP_002964083.1 probable leucine-rich repeat receptor-like protein kinase At5g63930 [Selaginella moellendorffii]
MGLLRTSRERCNSVLICSLVSLLLVATRFVAAQTSDDGSVLLELRSNLTDPLGSLRGWTRSTSYCSWQGIRCRNGTGTVTGISLSGRSLQGVISPAIGRLLGLQALDLSRNSISGFIPSEVTSCTQLTDINLSQNSLTGTIPQRLDLLPNLTSLRLFMNRLQGSIPASIGSLRLLTRLRVDDNELDGFIPSEIGNCSSLTFFQVYNNRLRGGVPATIGRLQRLTHLALYNNSLSGPLPRELGGCIALKRLTINRNLFQGQIPSELGRLVNLNEFQASSCNFTGSLPVELGSLFSLSSLDVSRNRLSGELPLGLGSTWRQMLSLNLSSNNITGSVPDSFGAMVTLDALDLSLNSFTGELPLRIGLLSNLSVLSLSGNQFQGPLPPALGMTSDLRVLNASNNRFSGGLPPRLCSSGNLSLLDLSNNRIEGTLLTVENCSSLQTLVVSNNFISGSFPQFQSLRLEVLDLSMNQMGGQLSLSNELEHLKSLLLGSNRFSGPMPNDFYRLPVLEALNVSRNLFQGSLPTLLSLTGLHTLDLSHNNISDTIPDYFSTFTSLTVLDISSNSFSGPIPSSLGELRSLDQFNFSNNQLSGEIPQITLFTGASPSVFMNNLNLCGPPLASCGSQPPAGTSPATPRSRRRRSAGRTVGLVFLVLGGVFLAATAIFLLCAYRALKRKKSTVMQENKFADRVPTLYTEIEKATEGFSDGNVIGTGPYGSVFRGIFAWEKILAVKVGRTEQDADDTKNTYYYTSAARKLNRIRHPNVVKLEDFLVYKGAKIFLYEYMPNKSLAEALHRPSGPKLHWNTRYKIAVGAAQGLSYLHHQYSIVHCDIKSNNVLLDSAFGARIADVGLAKLIGDSRNLSCLNRSFGYTAPEAAKVSQKADVYSFGVVLLELLTGKRPMMEDGTSLVSWVRNSIADDQPLSDIVDPILRNVNGPFQEEISSVFKIALISTDPSPARRPSMKDIVEVLSRIRREPGAAKLRSLRSFIHSRSFVLLSTRDDDQ